MWWNHKATKITGQVFSQLWWSSRRVKHNLYSISLQACVVILQQRSELDVSNNHAYFQRNSRPDNLRYRKSNLHVFSQWAGMSVWFIAAYDFTVVRFVAGVDMWMLLSVWWVSESSLTSVVLTFKRLLSWKINKNIMKIKLKL